MLSKNTIKMVKSLQLKKYRHEHQLFLVEGKKSVLELLNSSIKIERIIGTEEFIKESLNEKQLTDNQIDITNENTLSGLGTFDTNNSVIAIAHFKTQVINLRKDEKTLALDNIQDPGNLGTIIRTADWFGIKNIYCSENTVDLYNPKVISSTMGSFTRINIEYCNLKNKLETLSNEGFTIYGAFMDGKDINKIDFKSGLLVMGNEANGIRAEIKPFISDKIGISGHGNTESLNVAVATGIILNKFCNIN
jgi:TrmH family RNA methyltransferase